MPRFVLQISLALATAGAGAGCHRRVQQRAAQVQASGPRTEYWPGLGDVVIAPPPSDASGGGGGGGGGGGEGGSDDAGSRFHGATVYVDGEARAAFTYNEMPPQVKVSRYEWDPGEFSNHVLICDYFKALGVDCASIKESHWYGGRQHVAIITGEELRKNRDRFYFDFTRNLFGKPRVQWKSGVKTSDTIDVVSDVAIYVHKKPPRWDGEQGMLVDERGGAIDGVPYAQAEPRRSVRLNLDGRLAVRIKRNLLDGNVAPVNGGGQKDEEPRYALRGVLEANHLRVRALRGVDLVTRDERVVRLGAREAQRLEFTAPRHSHGEIVVEVAGHPIEVSALDVYAKLAPPDRPMRTLTLGPAARSSAVEAANTAMASTGGDRGGSP